MACRGVWTGTSPEAIPEANQEATVARPLAAAKGPVATTAVGKYWANNFDTSNQDGLLTDWVAFWKIWVVGDIVVFGFCPMWARLPVNHIFSFMYVCVLSFMRGS